jgi:hypothetical protein
MADRATKVTEVRESADGSTRQVTQTASGSVDGTTLALRIIWFLTGVLLTLLAFRFVLALLGANPANGFADFIYSASKPFVEPFFSLFNYQWHRGQASFEAYTLVAMLVYLVICYGLTKLVTIAKPRP